MGFEPLRAEPNGFLVHHLNNSATLSWCMFIVGALLVMVARRTPDQKVGSSNLSALI